MPASPITLLSALLLTASGQPSPGPEAPGSHEAYAKSVVTARDRAIKDALAAYDARRAAHPGEVTTAVERCRFLATLVVDDEDETDEGPAAEAEKCVEELAARFPHAKQALLYRLESAWEVEAAKALGRELLNDPELALTKAERAQVHAKLARTQQHGDPAQAAVAAREAMALDPKLDLTTIVASHLLAKGARKEAIAVLAARDEHDDPRLRLAKARMLLDAESYPLALEFLEAKGDPGTDAPMLYARALEGVGRTDEARAIYEGVSDQWSKREVFTRLLLMDLRRDDADAALRSYRALRDLGWDADPFGRHRLALSWRFPGTAWKPADLAGVLGLLGVVLLMALVPALWTVPIHHLWLWREERRRRKTDLEPPVAAPEAAPLPAGGPSDSAAAAPAGAPATASPLEQAGWGLPHAWLGVSVALVGQLLATWAYAYPEVLGWFELKALGLPPPDRAAIARAGVLVMLATALVVPILLGRRSWTGVLGPGRWTWETTWKRAMAWTFGLFVLAAVWAKLKAGLFGPGTDVTVPVQALATSDMIRAVIENYGRLATLLLVAGLVPVAEELLYRGVMLGAFQRHLSFGWANVLQATIFALGHDYTTGLPVIFALAVVTGVLRKRSGGLLAGILLHAMNNAVVVLVGLRAAGG